MNSEPSKFASIKLSRKLVERLKIEAAKAHKPMYVFVEELLQAAKKGRHV